MSDITVIIPAYNAVKTVERTIRSVMASVIPLEVWVVDDGSTDGTGSLLDELVGRQGEWKSSSTLRVIHQANCGAYQARLAALKRIATPYFGFVDFIVKNRIGFAIEALKDVPQVIAHMSLPVYAELRANAREWGRKLRNGDMIRNLLMGFQENHKDESER